MRKMCTIAGPQRPIDSLYSTLGTVTSHGAETVGFEPRDKVIMRDIE